MSRYRWLLARAMRALGHRGLAGLGCLVAGALAFQLAVLPMSAELEKARQEAGALREKTGGMAAGGQRPDPGDQIETFYRFLPAATSAPDLLDRIYSAASRRSVVLDQGEYRLTRERDGKIARYQITLPVRATYPQLRGFIEDVLEKVPSASLESMGFKREAISADTVEAQMRFVLYLGGAR